MKTNELRVDETTQIHLRIGHLDMFGYCGRDNHPVAAMHGLTAVVQRFQWLDENGMPAEDIHVADTRMWTAVVIDPSGTFDLETVDLLDHEIAALWIERL